MARLIDDIRAAGKLTAPFFVTQKREAWRKIAQFLAPMLEDSSMPVILIDNVADYMYTASDQEHWDLVRDFPNLAPPFPAFWTEHRMPSVIHSKECGDTDTRHLVPHGRVGALIRGLDPKDVKGEDIPANAKWILWCELFIDYGVRDRAIEGPHGSTFLCIDEKGVLIGHPTMQSYADPGFEEVMRSLMTWFNATFLAMSFLHCKNVVIQENEVPKPLAKKYRERHAGVQPTKYKTLIIEPLKQILRTQGRSSEVGLAKAMHICRGHFRDYREGRGLFGKYKQLVWSPMTIRGSKGPDAPPHEMKIRV